jgi:hypothetical protein
MALGPAEIPYGRTSYVEKPLKNPVGLTGLFPAGMILSE